MVLTENWLPQLGMSKTTQVYHLPTDSNGQSPRHVACFKSKFGKIL